MKEDMNYITESRWYKEGQAAASLKDRNNPENGCPYGEGSPKYLIWMQGWDSVANPPEPPLELGYFEHSKTVQADFCPVVTSFIWTLPQDQKCKIPQHYVISIPNDKLYRNLGGTDGSSTS